MLITFEGLDYSGKTTQANLLIARFRGLLRARTEEIRTLNLIREPGGTRISERIRELLLDKKSLEITEISELFLFSASRSQLTREVIVPALQRGEVVVCDRFFDSTTAYQGYGRGIDLEAIHTINRIASQGIKPDLTVLVNIPVEEIRNRKARAGLSFDRMESSGKDFYERVRRGYEILAGLEPDRFVNVNGMLSIQDLQVDIWKHVEERLLVQKQLV